MMFPDKLYRMQGEPMIMQTVVNSTIDLLGKSIEFSHATEQLFTCKLGGQKTHPLRAFRPII